MVDIRPREGGQRTRIEPAGEPRADFAVPDATPDSPGETAAQLCSHDFGWLIDRHLGCQSKVRFEQQTVISTGPYALVRHPMYLSMSVLFGMTPLALASYWALIPALAMIPILGVRIINEEKTLALDLPGYNEYLQKVKYRLLPGIW